MAYDLLLAERIRGLIKNQPGLTEKKMFGGLAFLINGNMTISASGHGGVMLRVDPNGSEALISSSHARVVEMRGRLMPGWLRIDTEYLHSDSDLSKWVQIATAYTRSLPPKQ